MDNPDKHLLCKIGQYAIISNSENKILLLKRKRSGNWSLPGGRLDKNDRDSRKALIREVEEETALEITNIKPFDTKLIEDKYQIKYCVFFTASGKNEDNIKISPEHLEYKWVEEKDLGVLTLDDEPLIRHVLQNYFNK